MEVSKLVTKRTPLLKKRDELHLMQCVCKGCNKDLTYGNAHLHRCSQLIKVLSEKTGVLIATYADLEEAENACVEMNISGNRCRIEHK